MIAKLLMPPNTIRRIVVAVPPKAEFEAGFRKWVSQLCRMGSILGCRVHFWASAETRFKLEKLIQRKYSGTPTEFSELENWGELLNVTGHVNYDHLFVVISARRGSISYDPSFESLPGQICKYFANNSLLLLFPDQFGDPQDMSYFSDPGRHSQDRDYDKMGKWLNKWIKKC